MLVVEVYREINKLSHEMLEFARQEQWEDLLETERKRAELIRKLPVFGDDGLETGKLASDEVQREELILLIKQIQSYDEETARCSRAWMNELGSVLDSMSSSMKLQQVYKTQ